MKVLDYSFNTEQKSFSIKVEDSLTEETILFLNKKGIFVLTAVDTKKVNKDKRVFRLKCSSMEDFMKVFNLLHKEIELK